MNKKFLSAILFGALMVFSTGTFVSCSDYDDDIDRIDSELADLKTQLSALQSQVNSGKYVTNVTKDGNGIKVTWNDGTTSTIETIKGDKGETGAQGAKGDATVITIDPVTKNWLVDGVDTGVCAEGKNGADGQDGVDGKDGKDAAKPIFTVGEDGHIYVQYGEDGEKEDLGASTGGIFYVDKGSYYELHICDAEGNWADIKLPMTKTITDLKAVTITKEYDANGKEIAAKIGDAKAKLYYGFKVTDKKGLTFNGKTYTQNTFLTTMGLEPTLSMIVNPSDADATKYEFSLMDSKGNAPIELAAATQNKSENPLSRAESANQGVWDMKLSYANAAKVAVDGVYALTTETYNGVVSSSYDVTIETEQVTGQVTGLPWSLQKTGVKCGAEFDLAQLLKGQSWSEYVVDAYFEYNDKVAAENNGVTLTGSIIKTSKNQTFWSWKDVKVNILFVTGQVVTINTEVQFVKDAPTAQLSDIEWTINDKTADVYLSLASIQSQLKAQYENYLPEISEEGYTWADGTALDKKSVIRNNKYYGADVTDKSVTKFAGNEESWIVELGTGLYHYDATNKAYVAASTIQKDLYAKFTFDYEKAFPGEYIINVGLKKAYTSDFVFVVPVKVNIKAPTVNPFSRLSAYFNGNEATAYGKVSGGVVDYNLFDLFKQINDKVNVTFTEETHDVKGHTCAPWIQTTGNKGDIKVAVYDNTANADNKDAVYSTRAIKAIYTIFGNDHIEQVVDAFNLTVKSEIFEGTLTAAAAASVSGTVKDEMKIDLKNVTAKDVYGVAYNLADTYVYNSSTKAYDFKAQDDRIAANGVKLVLADDNAKAYLAAPSAITVNPQGTPYFTVKSLNEQTALQSDVTCKLTLQVEDVWGKIKTVDVTVTLKK